MMYAFELNKLSKGSSTNISFILEYVSKALCMKIIHYTSIMIRKKLDVLKYYDKKKN